MKKIINKLSIFVLALAGLTSCHSALDVMPEGMLQYEDIFGNEVSTGAYLNNCYYELPAGGLAYNWWMNGPVIWSDNAHEYSTGSQDVSHNVYNGVQATIWLNKFISNTNYVKQGSDTSWNIYYRNIRKCNLFLSWIDTAAVPSEPERNEWRAEIQTLRAYYYMELLVRFGDVPLLTEALDINDDGSGLYREKFNVVADFIISECRTALECEDFPWRAVDSDNRERMTRAVAAGVMARTAVFKASPLFCDGVDYWAEAEEVTKEALDLCLANGYELFTTTSISAYGDNAYYEYITTDYTPGLNPTDKETILAFSNTVGCASGLKNAGPALFGAGKAGHCPSQEQVDAFPMTDGTYVLDLETPYLDEYHLEPNYDKNSSYDPQNPYANRDPRFDATIIYNGKTFVNYTREIQSYYGGADGILPGNTKNTSTGYYFGKTVRANCSASLWTKTAFRNIRLADLYLYYAEAAAENGNLATAVAAVKPIRDRVAMPNINPSNLEEAILMIRQERRVEFALDEQRYYDVRRWASPDGDIATVGKLTGMWIEKLDDGTFEYHRVRLGQSYDKATGEFTGTPWTRSHYTNKYLLEPLELAEVLRLEAATGSEWQNPGWD
ncbi:MAG: RagB/SusD family nutrient uptake outer membrane protein [Rikenellaceae bacterium]